MATSSRSPIPSRSHAASFEKQRAAGKALRDKVERQSLGKWKADKHRTSAIDIIRRSGADRVKELLPLRNGRMLQSPFAFYRGTAGVMASDLVRASTTGLTVQSCGDCHLVNFGGFATPERNIIFDINDFDETHPAPFDWDVRRLAASVVLAGRSIGLSDKRSRDCAVTSARNYRERTREYADMDPLRLWYSQISANDVMKTLPSKARKRLSATIGKATRQGGSEMVFPKLADAEAGSVRIREQPPLIYHPEISRGPGFAAIAAEALREYGKTLTDDRRALLDRYHYVDAALKVVGIGSVGRNCWIVLLMSDDNDPLFLQFKESGASVLEPFTGKSAYKHHGQRVVMGQRLMQPTSDIFLGWVTGKNGRQFYVRQLRDAKIKPVIESFDAGMLDVYAGLCGWALARAHAKASAVSSMISGYLGGASDSFDEAMGSFGVAYANQAERDHAAFKAAVRAGRFPVLLEPDR